MDSAERILKTFPALERKLYKEEATVSHSRQYVFIRTTEQSNSESNLCKWIQDAIRGEELKANDQRR